MKWGTPNTQPSRHIRGLLMVPMVVWSPTTTTTTTHAYCTARVYLCVFAQWGFLGADLSEFCCVSSSVGNMNIHEALLSLVKASCRSAECRSEGVHGCFVHTAEVNQCFIAVSLFFFFFCLLGEPGEVVSIKTVLEDCVLHTSECACSCLSKLICDSEKTLVDAGDYVIFISPVTWFISHVLVCVVIISALHLKKNMHTNTTWLCWKPALELSVYE